MTDLGARDGRGVRPEIQALRALAVLLVLLFHLWPGHLPGGYIGVDVFFVVSGFLITGHLLREADRTGRVALGEFWARRARRLLPAAYLVLAVTSLATLLWVPEGQWTATFRQVAGAATYVVNWVLAVDAVDYLAAADAPTAVQHYWTLSVEEQFYALWPLLVVLALFVAARTRVPPRTALAAAVGLATAASLAYSVWITAADPQWAYFSSPARAWQFGAGALLATWDARRRAAPARRRRGATAAQICSWLGLAALVACALVYDAQTPFPGTAALVPVAAAVAVIWAGMPAGRLSPAPLLGLRPVQVAGDVSYAAYLWHWPLIVLLPDVIDRELGWQARVGILLATFALAWATKRWVEDPVRHPRRQALRRPWVAGVASLVTACLVLGLAGAGWRDGREAERAAAALTERYQHDAPRCFGAASMDPRRRCHNPKLDGLLVPSGADVKKDLARYPECWTSDSSWRLKTCTFGGERTPRRPRVVLVGDSHARHLLPAFTRIAARGDIALTAQLKSGCAWSADPPRQTQSVRRQVTCPQWKERLRSWLVEHAEEIDLVVTTGYVDLLDGEPREQVDGLVRAWTPVAEAGVPIAAIHDNPSHDFLPSVCLERAPERDETTCAVTRAEAFTRPDPFAAAARKVPGAVAVDLTDYYCRRRICPSVIGGVNVYRDASHLTTTFARTLTPYLVRELRRAGALPAARLSAPAGKMGP